MVLKLYTAKIAVHEDKQWRAYKVKVIAKNAGDALNIIANKYGEVKIKNLYEMQLKEGMFL